MITYKKRKLNKPYFTDKITTSLSIGGSERFHEQKIIE